MTLDLNSGDLLCCFFFLFLNIYFGYPFNKRVRFTYFNSLFRSWAVEKSFLVRSRRVLTTDCLCCIGCSYLKLRYLSEWVDLRYTAESKWPLGEGSINWSENGRNPSFSFSVVNGMELSIAFRCVKNLDSFDFIMITKVPSAYLFHKRGWSVNVSKARVSMFSMTKFASTDDTWEPIAVPKTCL